MLSTIQIGNGQRRVSERRNVIFLDIDGPLLSARQWMTKENVEVLKKAKGDVQDICANWSLKKDIRFDPVGVWMFNTWAKYSNALIVLSTNWLDHTRPLELFELFCINGLEITTHKHFRTSKKMSSHRSSEIWSWLEEHDESVDRFIIVDDDYTVNPETLRCCGDDMIELAEHVVYVDYENGLSKDNFHHGLELLGVEPKLVYAEEFYREL